MVRLLSVWLKIVRKFRLRITYSIAILIRTLILSAAKMCVFSQMILITHGTLFKWRTLVDGSLFDICKSLCATNQIPMRHLNKCLSQTTFDQFLHSSRCLCHQKAIDSLLPSIVHSIDIHESGILPG